MVPNAGVGGREHCPAAEVPASGDRNRQKTARNFIVRMAIQGKTQTAYPSCRKRTRDQLLFLAMKELPPMASPALGYLIADDAHHRGEITMLARQVGHSSAKKAMFGMWEWGKRRSDFAAAA